MVAAAACIQSLIEIVTVGIAGITGAANDHPNQIPSRDNKIFVAGFQRHGRRCHLHSESG